MKAKQAAYLHTIRITYVKRAGPIKKFVTAQIYFKIMDIYECTHYRLRESRARGLDY